MIYIPLSMAYPGMTLAESVSAPSGLYSLLQRGESLSYNYINRLSACNIEGIYVEMAGTEGIEPKTLISQRVKQEMSNELRSIYINHYNCPSISKSAISSTQLLAGKIVNNILDCEEHLLDMMEIKSYDNYTYSHSLNVGILTALLASEIGITRSRLEDVTLCALMHDIGKLDVPIEIINKNGAVTSDEFEVIKTHPTKGVNRMRKCYGLSSEVLPGILSHHEKCDGSGYPSGYSGTQIPLFGRILAVADVYDALTSKRSYRKAWHPKEALEYILKGSGSQFDASLVQIFSHLISVYPTGTLVKLSDDSIAVVVKNYAEDLSRPRVRLLEDSPLGEKGYEIDLFEDIRYSQLTTASAHAEPNGVSFERHTFETSSETAG